MRFYLGSGAGQSEWGHKEAYMVAEENAYEEIDEELEDWLIFNMPGRYTIECEPVATDYAEVLLWLEFDDDTDAMAYKLRWE